MADKFDGGAKISTHKVWEVLRADGREIIKWSFS